MSEPTSEIDHAHFRQAPDESHNLKAIAVGITAIVIFLAGVLWAWLIMRGRSHTNVPEAALPAPNPPEPAVGMIFQYPFDPALSRPPMLTDQAEKLDDWSWSDRKGRRVYMPVRKAIELYLQNQPKGRDDD